MLSITKFESSNDEFRYAVYEALKRYAMLYAAMQAFETRRLKWHVSAQAHVVNQLNTLVSACCHRRA